MPEPSQPPPSTTAAAAAVGGFGGAILGAIAATALMGDGSDNDAQSAVQPIDSQTVEMVAKED